jgi:hypothetical protein
LPTIDATLVQARRDFAAVLAASAGAQERLSAARHWLIARGAEAVQIDAGAAPGLTELIRRAASAPAGPERRVFAVLILDALAAPGLLLADGSRTRLERDVCTLLEQALPHALVRSGYPFGSDLDARWRHLVPLASVIDDYLRPLEPSIPTWLSGRTQN